MTRMNRLAGPRLERRPYPVRSRTKRRPDRMTSSGPTYRVDSAFDQATDAGSLMAVQITAAAAGKATLSPRKSNAPLGRDSSRADSFSREGSRTGGDAAVSIALKSSHRHTVAPSPPASRVTASSPLQASSACNTRSPTVTEPCTAKTMRGIAGNNTAASLDSTSSGAEALVKSGLSVASTGLTGTFMPTTSASGRKRKRMATVAPTAISKINKKINSVLPLGHSRPRNPRHGAMKP